MIAQFGFDRHRDNMCVHCTRLHCYHTFYTCSKLFFLTGIGIPSKKVVGNSSYHQPKHCTKCQIKI